MTSHCCDDCGSEEAEIIDVNPKSTARRRVKKALKTEEVLDYVNDDSVPLTVVYKFSRDLPVERVRDEYRMVLERRMEKLGGDKSDPGILKLLNALSGLDSDSDLNSDRQISYEKRERCCDDNNNSINIVGDITSGKSKYQSTAPWIDKNTNSFKRGTEMAFSRQQGGRLVGDINKSRIVCIENNEKLCDAFFDVYLGDHPLSGRAKRQVGEYVRQAILVNENNNNDNNTKRGEIS